MKLDIPKFETQKELFDFLVENQESLIAQKCAAIKFADGFGSYIPVLKEDFSCKSTGEMNDNEISVKAVINTTGIMDSHDDVHIKGLWNKSLKENKRIMMLQEHKNNQFDKIIASGEDLKASVKDYTWKDLGYDAEGETQALVFDAKVKKSRNPYMFEQYKQGFVDNHSVGMQYTKLRIAINDKDYIQAKEAWDQYIDQVVNRADAERKGYFWAVLEAKAIEGSAVPNGSNPVTPTLEVKSFELGVEEAKSKAKEAAIKAFLGIK
jgi:hypothetical protein